MSPKQERIVAAIPIGARYTIDGRPVVLAEFLNANDIAGPELDQINRMEVGDEINFGGGAGPIFTLRRELDTRHFLAQQDAYQAFYGPQYLNQHCAIPGPGIEAEY